MKSSPREDWLVDNLILISNNPRESSIGLDEHVFGDENIPPIGDTFPKADEHTNVFVPPPNEYDEIDEDVLYLRWYA